MNQSSQFLSDFISWWLTTKKRYEVKDATYGRLLVSYNQLLGFEIAKIPISDLTQEDVSKYLARLNGMNYSFSTIKKQMELIRASMRHAHEQHIIPVDPCATIKMLPKAKVKKKDKEVLAYDKEEQGRVLELLQAAEKDASYAIQFMLETGIRVGEALALNWEDVDIRRKRVHVHKTLLNPTSVSKAVIQDSAKSDSSNRVVPLSPRAIEIMKTLDQRPHGDALFSNADGGRLGYQALCKYCKRICKKANIEYRGLHVWRHTFATNQYYKKTDIKVLSKILGHANSTITYNIYINLYGDGFDDMLNAVS